MSQFSEDGLQSGFAWRDPALDDVAAFEAFNKACIQADGPSSVGGPGYSTLLNDQGVRMVWAVVEATGEIAGLGWARPGSDRTWLGGKVHPDHRRKGLGTQLLRWCEASAVRSQMPGPLAIVNEALNAGSEALYTGEGYTCDFIELWMQRDLSATIPTIPAPLPLETWNPENASDFFRTYKEAFRERMNPGFPPPVMQNWIEENAGDPDFWPGLSLLARSGSEPVGFLTAGLLPVADLGQTVGWISQVGTHPAWRGRRLAAFMLAATMSAFKREGFTAVGLHVNVNNPGAIRLYEQLGFAVVGRRGKYRKSLPQ